MIHFGNGFLRGYSRINKKGQKRPKLKPDLWYIANVKNPREPHIVRIACWSKKYADWLIDDFYRTSYYIAIKGSKAIKLKIPIKKGGKHFNLVIQNTPGSRNYKGYGSKNSVEEDIPKLKVFTFINKEVKPRKYYVSFRTSPILAIKDFWLGLGLPLEQVVRDIKANPWILSPKRNWINYSPTKSINSKFYFRICYKNWILKEKTKKLREESQF